MLCRSLLYTAIITYLLCVLLLNGIQKEDLDVNTLNKLQQHNVNIDNLDYNNVRKQCEAKTTLKVTSEPRPVEISTTTDHIVSPIDSTLQNVINYLVQMQKTQHKVPPLNKTENNETALVEDIIRKRVKTDREPEIQIIENLRQNSPIIAKSIEDTKRDTSLLNLNGIFKAFKLLEKEAGKIRNTSPKTTLFEVTENMNLYSTVNSNIGNDRGVIPDHSNNSIESLSKILAELISKRQILSTTTPTTTTANINLDSISRQIEKLLKINSNIENSSANDKGLRRYNLDDNEDFKTLTTFPKNKNSNNPRISKNNSQVAQTHNDNLLKNNLEYVNRALTIQGSLIKKESTSEPTPGNSKNSPSIINLLKYMKELDLNQAKYINNKTDSLENKHVITQEVIEEIAEKVKTLVIKDIQKEITTTTIKTSSTTMAEHGYTTTQGQEIGNVMVKFMELFQQLQSTKKDSHIPVTMKAIEMEQVSAKHVYNALIPPIFKVPNPYGIKNVHQDMPPIIFNQHFGIVTTPSLLWPPDKTVIHKINQLNIFDSKTGYHTPVITMQTNLNEIPPLRIPVPKSLIPINQNIIVTTRNPFLDIKENHKTLTFRHGTHDVKYNNENRKKYLELAKRVRQQHKNGNHKYRGPSTVNLNSKSNERHRIIAALKNNFGQENREMLNQRNEYKYHHNIQRTYKPYYRMSKEERDRYRNDNIKKFHEKLEKTDEGPPGSKEYIENRGCCKIPERQQRPLKGVKYPKYDDRHFRSFFKTQQKVNDMLEKILATKTETDGLKSVETQ